MMNYQDLPPYRVTAREEYDKKMAIMKAEQLRLDNDLKLANDERATAEIRHAISVINQRIVETEQVFLQQKKQEIEKAKEEESRLAEVDLKKQQEIDAYVAGVGEKIKDPDGLQAEKAKIEERIQELEARFAELQKKYQEMEQQRNAITAELKNAEAEAKDIENKKAELATEKAERTVHIDNSFDALAAELFKGFESQHGPISTWGPETLKLATANLSNNFTSLGLADSPEEAVSLAQKLTDNYRAADVRQQAEVERKEVEQIKALEVRIEAAQTEPNADINAMKTELQRAVAEKDMRVAQKTKASELEEQVKAGGDPFSADTFQVVRKHAEPLKKAIEQQKQIAAREKDNSARHEDVSKHIDHLHGEESRLAEEIRSAVFDMADCRNKRNVQNKVLDVLNKHGYGLQAPRMTQDRHT